jgi:hypothetical protein
LNEDNKPKRSFVGGSPRIRIALIVVHKTKLGRMANTLRTVLAMLFVLSSISVMWVVVAGSYDVRLGPVHLAAHGLFKPLLELNGLLLFLWAIAPPAVWLPRTNGSAPSTRNTLIVIVCIVLFLYGPSILINVAHPEWNHREISARIQSVHDVTHLFLERQADGFYRPLTYVSLLVDYRLFRDTLWAYHLQSIALHILNAWLLVRLAGR